MDTLFPYTTLFRRHGAEDGNGKEDGQEARVFRVYHAPQAAFRQRTVPEGGLTLGPLGIGVAEWTRLALDLRDAAGVPRYGRAALVGIILAADILALDRALRLLARQRLIFEQRAGEQVELVDIVGQHLAFGLFAFLDEAADLGVDQFGWFFGHILSARHAVAEENLVLIITIAQPAELFGHEIGRAHV